MKVEIAQFSSNPANTLLDVYPIPSTRPLCRIYEEDLYEVMTDAQIKQWENGKYILDLPKQKLLEKSLRNF